MRPYLSLLLPFVMVAHAAAGAADPERPSNPYASHYVSRLPPPVSAGAAPRIYRGADRAADYQRLLEDGYDLLGHSAFEERDVPPELLREQAARLNADLALVYTRQLGSVPASVRLEQAKSRARQGGADGSGDAQPPQGAGFYQYYATYWTRLPMPLLGVHVQRAGQSGAAGDGLDVIAVIKGSPAAEAGLRRGDRLLQLGEVRLREPEALVRAAQRYAGQGAELVFARRGEEQRRAVTLNARQ